MRREDGYERREDEPTRPVRVPALSPVIRNDTSRIIRVDVPPDLPRRDPTVKLNPPRP